MTASTRRSWALAGGTLAFGILLHAASLLLRLAGARDDIGYGLWTFLILTGPCLIMGALIVAHLPRHPVGWLLVLVGVFQALNAATRAYADFNAGAVPLARWVDAFAEVNWLPSLAIMVTLLPLFYPTGRPPGPRWRWIAYVAVGCMALVLVFGTIVGWYERRNIVTGAPSGEAPAMVSLPMLLGFFLLIPATLLSVASAFVRFRRSRGIERQQLKWFAFAVFVCFVVIAYQFAPVPIGDEIAAMVVTIGFVSLPASIAVAVLRYRLYEIDRLINRALVYGLLSTLLIGVYIVLIVILQAALESFVSGSDPAVAVSTLGVAALFRPLRARVQETVDRRFYRRKYNATRTLDAFASRLRDEIELDALTDELRMIIHETLQPAHVSLWLRALPPSR